MNQKIIVIDNDTEGIMCQCSTISIAHSISLGFINSSVKILPSNIPWQSEDYNKNFNNRKENYQYTMGKISAMNPDLITEKWIALRDLARLRHIYHLVWETRCNQFLLNRNIEYPHMEMFDAFLWRELDACRPETQYYTQSIIEWATLSDVDPQTAYQELKLKAQTIGLQFMRNHAIHQKYVFLLNQETTEDNLKKVIARGISQLIVKAQI